MNIDRLVLAEQKTKADRVLEVLRDAIISGELKPGQPLRPVELAREFGTSSTPVRGALGQLEAEGLVTRVAYRGTFVTEFSATDLDEIYEMRKLLEGIISWRAVEVIVEEGVIEAVAHTLRSIQDEMELALRNEEFGELARKNKEFHLFLYERAGSPRFHQVIAQLLSSFPIEPSWRVTEGARIFTKQHDEILKAVEAGDPELVSRLVISHLEDSRKMLRAHLET